MIHIRNNYTNNLVFVETLPQNYTLYIRNNATKKEYSFSMVNELTVNTQSIKFLTNIEGGEYTYMLISDNYTYETGLCKVASDVLPIKKTHKKTTTNGFKTHKK